MGLGLDASWTGGSGGMNIASQGQNTHTAGNKKSKPTLLVLSCLCTHGSVSGCECVSLQNTVISRTAALSKIQQVPHTQHCSECVKLHSFLVENDLFIFVCVRVQATLWRLPINSSGISKSFNLTTEFCIQLF